MPDSSPYGGTVRDHFRRPRNQGPMPDATASAEGVNPLCGDRVRVALKLDGNGTITDARFVANACAICVASASLLTERVRGSSREVAAALSDEDIFRLIEEPVPVARRRCATLPLEALRRALASQ